MRTDEQGKQAAAAEVAALGSRPPGEITCGDGSTQR
jgi:hypothetical protein